MARGRATFTTETPIACEVMAISVGSGFGIGSFLALFVLFALASLPLALAAQADTIPLEIGSSARFTHSAKNSVKHRAPVRFNDNHDTGLHYQARRFWRCAEKCPDGICDHRTREPVWDYLYVGGRVEGERDLLEITLKASAPGRRRVALDVAGGGECIRIWPDPKKGVKSSILRGPGLVFSAGDLPRTLYVEGIRPGTAQLHLRWEDGGDPDEAFVLHVDVAALTVTQNGLQRFIYDPRQVTIGVEPADVFKSPAYRRRIVWSGDVSGTGHQLRETFDPGEKADLRRAVYRPRATVADSLVLEKTVRVRQKVFTGTAVAETTAARRREVERMLAVPDLSFKNTELPDRASTQFSQTWFERQFTGVGSSNDPVKPINQTRLQYAPLLGRGQPAWGLACCYLSPYGVFITKLAYDDGLKLEDLTAVAHHELRHLTHYSTMYAATGFWHVLCRYLDHETATHFMEADASSASLHSNASWRFIYKCGYDMINNYRSSSTEIEKLPGLSQMESAITVLQDIYAGIPADMDEFKRPEYECHIRPPLEIDERR